MSSSQRVENRCKPATIIIHVQTSKDYEMNRRIRVALRASFVLVMFLPMFGCSESDDGSKAVQAQPEPAREIVTAAPETETVAPATETVIVDIEEGVPGGTFTDIIDVSAEVTAVNTENRVLMLKNSDGEELTVQAGPQAVNFDQIQVGDIVNARIIKELVIGLKPKPAEMPGGDTVKSLARTAEEADVVPDGTAGLVARAVEGAQPGGLMAETTQITATIEAIDEVNRTATLSLEDGSSRTVPVRDDIDLSQRKVGEKVVFYITEAFAISVEKP